MRKLKKKRRSFISEKNSSQDIFSGETATSLGRKLEKQYGVDHRKQKHMTREEGRTSPGSENCDSEIEKSEASFKVENQKSENAQPLNKILPDLSQPIHYKEGDTEVDNFAQFIGKVFYSYALKNIKLAKFSPSDIIYHPDINKAASLNKNVSNRLKEIDEESDGMFGYMVKQMSMSKNFQQKINFAPSSKKQYPRLRF